MQAAPPGAGKRGVNVNAVAVLLAVGVMPSNCAVVQTTSAERAAHVEREARDAAVVDRPWNRLDTDEV